MRSDKSPGSLLFLCQEKKGSATTIGQFLSHRGPHFFCGAAKKKKGHSGCPSNDTKTRAQSKKSRAQRRPSLAKAKPTPSAAGPEGSPATTERSDGGCRGRGQDFCFARASETPARGSTAPLRSNGTAVAKPVVSAPWQLAGCFNQDSWVKQPSLGAV